MARRHDCILIIDDDDDIRSALIRFLPLRGYETCEAASAAAAEAVLVNRAPDLALVDLRLPDGDGVELIPRLLAARPGMGIVVLTGHGSIESAVLAVKRGADHFLTKPIDTEALLLILERVLQGRRSQQRALALADRKVPPQPLLGGGKAIAHLSREVETVRETDLPVLIRGETGTGKGVLARWLHENGPRREGPFVDLNCAGISRELLDAELFGYEPGAFTGAVKRKQGLLEVAHGGTVFLDEVGDMDPAIQARLLKVVEEKRFRRLGDVRDRAVDIRLVAATHQDLERLMREGLFRRDLYYRICAVELRVPALRERPEDLEALSSTILEALGRELGRPAPTLTQAAIALLQSRSWPGNVRELRNVLEGAALRSRGGGSIGPEDLRLRPDVATDPERPAAPDADLAPLADVERQHIERVLAAVGGHVANAARILGVSTSSLYDRTRRLGLSFGRERAAEHASSRPDR